MHRYSRLLLRGLTIWLAIRHRRSVMGSIVVTPEIVRMAIISTSGLRDVWHDLHAPRNDTSRATTPSCIGRRSRTSKSLSELLEKCATNVVCSNVNGIGYAKDHKRSLS